MPQYWVVGAMYGGHEDQSPRFIRHGFWTLGWTEHLIEQEAPEQVRLRDQMRAGDRIAIKRMMGQGASEIKITAIGVVTEIDLQDKRVYVRWAVDDIN
jgi:hypothetical protein